MIARLAACFVSAIACLPGVAMAVGCQLVPESAFDKAMQGALAEQQQYTRHAKPLDGSIIRLARGEDLFFVLREFHLRERYGYGRELPSVSKITFHVGPYRAAEAFLPTLDGDDWICLLAPGSGVFISDGFTHHYTPVYRLDPSEQMVWFADIWPDNFMLSRGRNAVGIAAKELSENGAILHGVSFDDIKRVAGGIILDAGPELQIPLLSALPRYTSASEQARLSLLFASVYPGVGAGAARALFEPLLKDLPLEEKTTAVRRLRLAAEIGEIHQQLLARPLSSNQTAQDELLKESALEGLCDAAGHSARRAQADAAALLFPLLRLAGPLSAYCPASISKPAVLALADAVPSELEFRYWLARICLAASDVDCFQSHIDTLERAIDRALTVLISDKVADRREFLRTRAMDTSSYNYFQHWAVESARLRMLAGVKRGVFDDKEMERLMSTTTPPGYGNWRTADLYHAIGVALNKRVNAFTGAAVGAITAPGEVAAVMAMDAITMLPNPADQLEVDPGILERFRKDLESIQEVAARASADPSLIREVDTTRYANLIGLRRRLPRQGPN